MGGRFKSDTMKQSFFVSLVSVTHRHTHTNTHSLLHLARQRCAGDELLICFVRLLWTAIWNKIRGFVLIAAKNKHVWRHFCSWGDLTAEGAQSTWDSSLKLWVEMKIYPFVHSKPKREWDHLYVYVYITFPSYFEYFWVWGSLFAHWYSTFGICISVGGFYHLVPV